MKKLLLKSFLFLGLILASVAAWAQVPVLNYAGSPYSLGIGATITPILPNTTNTVGVYGTVNATWAAAKNTGVQSCGLAFDNFTGFLYGTEYTYGELDKIVLGTNGTVSNLNSTTTYFPGGTGYSVVTDAAGTVYVSDNNTSALKIEEFATGTFGSTSNNITGFVAPKGIAIDASNNLYVVDAGNGADGAGKIYKFALGANAIGSATTIYTGLSNPFGVAIFGNDIYVTQNGTTLAGQGIFKILNGVTGSTAVSAFSPETTAGSTPFKNPRNLTFDQNGTLFVADYGNARIDRITPSNVITNITGLINPNQVAFDTNGNLYVGDLSSYYKKVICTYYTITAGLPPGLTFNTVTGAITGSPTTAGTYAVTVTAMNSTGTSAGQVLNFNIGAAVTITATSLNTNTNPNPPTANLTPNPISSTGSGLPIYGLQLTAGSTGSAATITSLNFTAATSPAQNNSYFFTNAYLYSSTSPTYATGGTLLATITGTGLNTTTLNFSGFSKTISAGQTLYYYVVVDYATPVVATETYQLNFTSATGATVTGTPSGYNYNFPALTLTATSLNTATNPAQPTANLTPNPIAATGAGLPIYGLQIAASGTGPSKTITALNFTAVTSPAQNNSYFFTNAYLYSSTSPTYTTGGTLLSTITGTGLNATTLNFSGFNSTIAAGQTLYYYVVVDYTNPVAAAETYQLNFTSATGATVTGTPVAGYNYNFSTLTITATSLNTATNPTQPTAGLTPNPISATASGLPIYGLQLAASGTGPAKTITALNFTQSGAFTQYNNYFMANAYLYAFTSPTYTAGGGTLLKTISGVTATTALNFTGLSISVSAGQTLYYFVVIDYTTPVSAAANFQLNFTSATGATVTGTPAGYKYNFTAVTVTLVSLGATGTSPTNGLTTNPLFVGSTGLPVYGFSLVGSGTGPAANVTGLTFYLPTPGYDSDNFTSMGLYSSPNAMFPGVGQPGVSLLATYNSAGGTDYATLTPSTPITVASGATQYYFLVISNITNYATSFEQDFSSSSGTGTTVVAGTNSTGFNYTVTSPSLTFANNTTGINQTAPYLFGSTTDVLESFSVTANTPSNLTSFTLVGNVGGTNTAPGTFFSNPQVFSSTSPTYTAGSMTAVSGAVFSNVTNGIKVTIPAQLVNSTPLYYFVAADFTNGAASLPSQYQFTITSAAANTVSSGIAFTSSPALAYTNYKLGPAVYVTAASTANFPASTLANSQTSIPIIGFAVSSFPSNTFTTFNFTTTESAGNVGTYFYNVRLYSSTTNSFNTATQVTDPGLTVSALTGANFSISGLTQTISNTTIYYFVVVDYTAPNPGPQTFTPTLASVVTSTPTTYSTSANGLPITGTTYTMKTITSYTYYWWGNGATTDWRNPANWTTATDGSGTNAGAYPGVFVTDNANFNFYYWYPYSNNQYPTIGAYNISISNLNVYGSSGTTNYTNNIYLTVNSADSLTVSTLNIGLTGSNKQSILSVAGTSSGTTSLLRVSGATTLYNNDFLIIPTGGVVTFPSATSVTVNGTNTNYSEINVTGGTLNIYSTPVNLSGVASGIYVSSGTSNISKSTLTFSANSSQLITSGGVTNLAGSTINVTGATASYLAGLGVSGGTLNIGPYVSGGVTTNSIVSLSGTSSALQATGGTLNVGAGTVVTLSGATTAFSNSGSGAVNCASTSIININNATAVMSNSTSGTNPFTLMSDANGSATVAAITAGGKTTGNFAVQRYITGGSISNRGYRLVSSPVNAATVGVNKVYSLYYPINNIYLKGTGGTGAGFDAAGNPNLYLFRENLVPSNTSFTSGNFRGVATLGTASNYAYSMDVDGGSYNVPVGNGFLMFFRGDRNATDINTESSTTYVPVSATLTATGALNQGSIAVNNWYNTTGLLYSTTAGTPTVQGFNLIGNPYSSSIDWDNYSTSAIPVSNVGSSIYVLDNKSQNYNVYQAGSASKVGTIPTANNSNVISSGQGFFVQAGVSGATLTFNETAKTNAQVTAAQGNLFMGDPPLATVEQYMRLIVAKDSVHVDGVLIKFKQSAKAQYVFGEDAPYKLGNGPVSLASTSADNIGLAINTLPLPAGSQAIKLQVGAATDGTYTLALKEIASVPQIYDVWLKDAYRKDSLDIRHNPTYVFDVIKSDTNSFGGNRFSLIIRQNPLLALHLLDFTGSKITAGTQVVWKTENEQNYTNFTVERSVDNGSTFQVVGGFASTGAGTYSFIDKNPVTTTNDGYRLKLVDLNGRVTYSNIVTIQYANNSNNIARNGMNIYPNPATGTINVAISQTISTPSYGIQIVNNLGAVVRTATSPTTNWQADVSKLIPGTYIIKVINNGNKTEVGKGTFVKM